MASSKRIVFVVEDALKNSVKLTEQTSEHIRNRHDDLESTDEDFIRILQDPELIRNSSTFEDVKCFEAEETRIIVQYDNHTEFETGGATGKMNTAYSIKKSASGAVGSVIYTREEGLKK